MSNPPRIPWDDLEKVLTVINGPIQQLSGSKDFFGLEICEKKIPDVFSMLHEIIYPALSKCGLIKGEKDLVPVLIKNVLKLLKKIQHQMGREENLAECLALMKSEMVSMGVRVEEIMPQIQQSIEANFDTLNEQLQSFKNDIIQAIQSQQDNILREKDQQINDLTLKVG